MAWSTLNWLKTGSTSGQCWIR